MDKKEWVKLCWDLLEAKIIYYRFPQHCTLPDSKYDEMEIEYLKGCREFKQANTLVHKGYPGFEDIEDKSMMEIDESRESVKTAITKIKQKLSDKLL